MDFERDSYQKNSIQDTLLLFYDSPLEYSYSQVEASFSYQETATFQHLWQTSNNLDFLQNLELFASIWGVMKCLN